MTFNGEINLGHVLVILSFIGSGFLGVLFFERRWTTLNIRVTAIEEALREISRAEKEQVKIMVELAHQSEQINSMFRRMDRYEARLGVE